ncbi:MAG: hypothetical protein KC493_11925 [Bacteriovoracaceae bacterium]|nr:hypothetical protein [Bacteriovoracaceae bacterium]
MKSVFIYSDQTDPLLKLFKMKELSSLEHESHVYDQLTQLQLDGFIRQALEGKCLIWNRLTASSTLSGKKVREYLSVWNKIRDCAQFRPLPLNQWGRRLETWKQWRFVQKYSSKIKTPWFYLGPIKDLNVPLNVEQTLTSRVENEVDFKSDMKLFSHENGLIYQKPKGIRVKVFFMGDHMYLHYPSLPDSEEFNSIEIEGIEETVKELKSILGITTGEFLFFYRSQELIYGHAEIGPSEETVKSRGFVPFLLESMRKRILQ